MPFCFAFRWSFLPQIRDSSLAQDMSEFIRHSLTWHTLNLFSVGISWMKKTQFLSGNNLHQVCHSWILCAGIKSDLSFTTLQYFVVNKYVLKWLYSTELWASLISLLLWNSPSWISLQTLDHVNNFQVACMLLGSICFLSLLVLDKYVLYWPCPNSQTSFCWISFIIPAHNTLSSALDKDTAMTSYPGCELV